MKKSRREFIIRSALAASALSVSLDSIASRKTSNKFEFDRGKNESSKVSVFSKNLQWLTWEEMAVTAKEMGFDGIDLTVRPQGHVLPERVMEDLPKVVDIITKQRLNIYTITTAITTASDKYTVPILKTAGELGIENYRMAKFSYDKKVSNTENLLKFKNELKQLEQLNKKYKIHGQYQNHAGEFFGSAVLDLWSVLKDLNPEWIGCQYDIRHATVEGAHSWSVGFGFLRDHIKTINLKDFQWTKKDGKWQEENVPLGTGMVDLNSYFKVLKEQKFNGPVSLHYEYKLGGAEDGATTLTIPKEEVLNAMKTDLSTFKQLFNSTGNA